MRSPRLDFLFFAPQVNVGSTDTNLGISKTVSFKRIFILQTNRTAIFTGKKGLPCQPES